MEEDEKESHRRRKKRKNMTKKERKRRKNTKKRPDSSNVSGSPFEALPNSTPNHVQQSSTGSLYEGTAAEFTKQRRHSNLHIQDELYQPGILVLDKRRASCGTRSGCGRSASTGACPTWRGWRRS